jgi:hypothetical protein
MRDIENLLVNTDIYLGNSRWVMYFDKYDIRQFVIYDTQLKSNLYIGDFDTLYKIFTGE